MGKYIIEVCANSAAGAINAQIAEADRVELCSGLSEGGLTPSFGEMAVARDALNQTKLNVLIRPRGGDFLYTPAEQKVMFLNIEMAKKLGVDGIVIGCLTPQGDVDTELMKLLISKAGGLDITFHRAFDMCCDPFKAIHDIAALGCKRILTSGMQATAEEGIPTLKELIDYAAQKIIIMPGCGINSGNIRKIATETGAREFHFSAANTMYSKMLYRNQRVKMTDVSSPQEYEWRESSVYQIKEITNTLNQ